LRAVGTTSKNDLWDTAIWRSTESEKLNSEVSTMRREHNKDWKSKHATFVDRSSKREERIKEIDASREAAKKQVVAHEK